MPLCLSLFQRMDEAVLRNHAHYCRLFGYAHQWMESDRLIHPALRASAKYSQILRHLRMLAEGDWLLFLDGDSVVFHPVAVETLIQGRDLLAAEGPPTDGQPGPAMTNTLVVRNVAANRALLHQLIVDSGHVVALESDRLDEAVRLRPAGLLACNGVLADVYFNVSWRIAQWHDARVFVVNLASLPVPLPGGGWRDEILHDVNLQALLVREVNGALMHGRPALQPPRYPALGDESVSSLNPSARIAFLTLYTHHVQTYARVSEHNVRRYCERHGYAYHVYRAIPAEIGPGINGSWVRSWLLQQHLANHDWVIWVDADVLFFNQTRPIDPLLQGRDLLLAKDVGAWLFNSGVMGFRNTPRNLELLAQIWSRIGEVADKSGVYTSMGDQYYTNEVLNQERLLDERSVLDNLTINTPPLLASEDTLLVHFVSLVEPYRSVYMAAMDTRSQRIR
ncbi:galactosyl transferase GMA12/MNN10 family protein [Variovorax sp. Root411]|uniref:galactosyl transferase GMA12/MNN10 family protein n=1 Tax=Variovorax sp. Root411 TaxID=1736530 RepID=UPI0006FB6040|nr:galactosyl transferase GMA12/MNN10 family protein [Variovorax sp. Root411]KQW64372.1 galactosyl transferase GMA12/MNN10 family protein [Variovorax sp. Root411]